VATGNNVDLLTRVIGLGAQGKKFANVVDLKPQLSGVTNEIKPRDVCRAVTALLAFGPGWRLLKKANCLIIPDRCHVDAGKPRRFSN
jgi:hypothetical protein